MAIVKVENLRKEFGDRILFSDISFSIEPRDHIGLIGVNGNGKTTLLKMLLNEENYDGGILQLSSQIRIAHMEQSPNLSLAESLFDFVLSSRSDLVKTEEELNLLPVRINDCVEEEREKLIYRQSRLSDFFEREGGLTYRAMAKSAILGLGFHEDDLSRPVTEFSGGQIGKAMICRTILMKADLLLLDEPTNNLDIPAINYLQDFLSNYKGAFLVVSHDRSFLDASVNKIIEIENGHIYATPGNYSKHLELKQDARESARRKYIKTLKEIKRIENIIIQQKRWNQERNYVTIASKEKQIERLRETLVAPEKDPQTVRFHFRGAEPAGNEIFSVKNLSKSFLQKTVFSNVDFLIWKGETVCVIGENGCGKSTLLKILNEDLSFDNGTVIKGAGVRLGYFEQNADNLNPDNTVAEEILETYPRMEMSEVRALLGCFMFRGDDLDKRITLLSGGERARIKLLKLVLSGANVLLLDEPTNHFDIRSCEVMESALEHFDGTVIIVTHDRYLVERMADRVLYLGKDGIEELDIDEEDVFSHIKPTIGIKNDKSKASSNQNYYKKQKENKALLLKIKQSIDRIEASISQNEFHQQEIHEKMLSAQNSGKFDELQALCIDMANLENENARLYDCLEADENRYEELKKELME